jgi:hypothetical protein
VTIVIMMMMFFHLFALCTLLVVSVVAVNHMGGNVAV